MIIGILNEQYENDPKVSIIPEHAKLIIENGHKVYITSGAGKGAGISDQEYSKVGCILTNSNNETIHKSNVVSSYKIPKEKEVEQINKKILICYQNINNHPKLLNILKENKTYFFATEAIKEVYESNSEINSKAFYHELNSNINKIFHKGIYKTPNIEKDNFLIFGYNSFSKKIAKLISQNGHNATIITDKNIHSIENIEILINTKENIKKYLSKSNVVILTGYNPYSYQKRIFDISELKTHTNKKLIVDTTMEKGGGIDYSKLKKIGNQFYKYEKHYIYSPKNLLSKFSKNISTTYSSSIYEYVINILNKNLKNKSIQESLIVNNGKEKENMKVKKIEEKNINQEKWKNLGADEINIALTMAQVEESKKELNIIED